MSNKPSDHYEVTEQKIRGDERLEHELSTDNQPKLQLNFLDQPVSVGRAIVAMIIIIIALVWGLAVKGDNTEGIMNHFGCAGIIFAGLALAYWILRNK